MMLVGLKLLISYLLGSISGSLLVGRFRNIDIRTMGSGNAGGTNAFRTQGVAFALAAIIIDIGKAMVSAGPVAVYGPSGVVEPWLPLACGFASVVGHCYPVYHGFRGGKGAATAVGALIVTAPMLLVPMIASWLVVLVITGYVGLATITAGFSLIPAAIYHGSAAALVVFCIAVALFMLFTHRSNIARMRQGQENRFEKARLLNWFRR